MSDELLSRLIVSTGAKLAQEVPSTPSYGPARMLDELGITSGPDLDATVMTQMPVLPGPAPALPTLGRYQVVKEIGRGAAGEIYEGFDPELRRTVAIKVLKQEVADKQTLERFVAEAQVTAQLDHPGIVPVHDMGITAAGRFFYVMKLVQGLSMFQILGGIARREPATLVYWTCHRRVTGFVQVCRAIAYAHERGVVHRDLKPSNLMFGAHDVALVLDWGIARVLSSAAIQRHVSHHTTPGTAIGTLGYMSPEQMMGAHDQLGPSSDVWSLGVILYELLTIRRGFKGAFAAVSAQASSGPLRVVGISEEHAPPALCAIIERATRVAIADRFPTARELGDAVYAYLERGA